MDKLVVMDEQTFSKSRWQERRFWDDGPAWTKAWKYSGPELA